MAVRRMTRTAIRRDRIIFAVECALVPILGALFALFLGAICHFAGVA